MQNVPTGSWVATAKVAHADHQRATARRPGWR